MYFVDRVLMRRKLVCRISRLDIFNGAIGELEMGYEAIELLVDHNIG